MPLSSDRGAPRAGPGVNLPTPLTSFVGRSREVLDLDRVLRAQRLVTVLGAGGSGKSRLALVVADAARARHPGGRWWLELGSLRDRDQVEAALAAALGVRALPGHSALEAAQLCLADRQALVVLDNCEHLVDAVAAVAETLLRTCAGLVILATSRSALGIAGESRWRLEPMSLPSTSERDVRRALEASDALRLFCERASCVRSDFALTSENIASTAAICRAVEGIPLAIELAAARMSLMGTHEIAAGLNDCLHLLTGGPRTAPAHQQTLRASVRWSHDLLTTRERLLLRRVAVFEQGWTRELAEAIASDSELPAREILDVLTSLVDKSLVSVDHREPSTRYRLLDAVRQYALERLDEAGETSQHRLRHRDAMLEFAERAERQLTGSDQRIWFERLDDEHANLQRALDHAIATDPDVALRLVIASTLHYRRSGRFRAAEESFRRALAAAPTDAPRRSRALCAQAYLRAHGGSFTRAIEAAEQALGIAVDADPGTAARALAVIGYVLQFPDPAAASVHLERSRALARSADDPWCEGFATLSLAWTHHVRDRNADARRCAEEARELIERGGFGEFRAKSHLIVALEAFAGARWHAFEEECERGLAAARAVDEPLLEGSIEVFVGWSLVLRGRFDDAAARMPAARERAIRAGAGMILPGIEYVLAGVDLAHGDAGAAAARLEAIVATGIDGGPYLARALLLSCEAQRALGDATAAGAAAQAALRVAQRLGSASLAVDARLAAATLHIDAREWAAAGERVHEALEAVDEHRLVLAIGPALEALAHVSAERGQDHDAARLLGAARRARAEHETTALHRAAEVAALERAVSMRIGSSELSAAVAAGDGLAPDDAVAWARRGRGPRRRPASGWESLTPTEHEVVERVVAGMTNPQIAEQMFITRGTVKTHLAHIYAKLDVKNRSQLAVEATRHEPHR